MAREQDGTKRRHAIRSRSSRPSFRQGAQSGSRLEDVPLVTGAGRFTDDLVLPGQAHAVFVRSTFAHADIVSVDTSAAAGNARRARRHHRPGARRRRHRPHSAAWRSLRGAMVSPCSPPGCRRWLRPRPLRRRAGRARRRRDRRLRRSTRPKRWRSSTTSFAAVCDVARAMAQDAPQLWPEACRQHRARLGGRRRRRRRCGLRARCSCRARASARHAACAERHGAARCARNLRSPNAALHTHRADAGRRRGAQDPDRSRVQGSDRENSGPHARRRRRLRHEGADLLRVCRPALCRAPHRPAREVARHAAGELPRRHARPRRRARG